MCGIVGLFLKSGDLCDELGSMFARMLIEMTDRGPDSAGVAVYREGTADGTKLTLFSPDKEFDWSEVTGSLESTFGGKVVHDVNASHCVMHMEIDADKASSLIEQQFPALQIMSLGSAIEIYKETGLPAQIVDDFSVRSMTGTHAVGHTRMATESAVTTAGSHPFSTGRDVCLVHNGSLSNHNRLRDRLTREYGVAFRTENDTEVAAAYMTCKLESGRDLKGTFEDCIDELDGFYTFVAGTRDGFAVLRDPIACKPAVLAETDDFVAFASEYRALVTLPDIKSATVWEPEPAVVYSWESRT